MSTAGKVGLGLVIALLVLGLVVVSAQANMRVNKTENRLTRAGY